MANEIRVKTQLSVANGFVDETDNISITVDQSAVGGPTPGYLTIGTSEESVAFSELGTKGWVLLRNLDDTNFVEWGFSTGVYGGKMLPGETAGPFRMNTTSIFLKADTAACKCIIKGYEA
jgi:hypothetical protein